MTTLVRENDVAWPQQIRLEPYERGSTFRVSFELYNPANDYDPCTDPVIDTPFNFAAGSSLSVKTFVENELEPASTDAADITLYRATWRIAMAGIIEDVGTPASPAVISLLAFASSMERGYLPGSLHEVRIHVFQVLGTTTTPWLEIVLPLEDVGL